MRCRSATTKTRSGRQIDQHGVPPADREERVACPVHPSRQLRGSGETLQRARADAPGVEQVVG